MSMLRRLSGARPLAAATRGAVGRTIARAIAPALGLGRPEVLDETRMPAWQLRDLGFRDGRDTADRRSRDI